MVVILEKSEIEDYRIVERIRASGMEKLESVDSRIAQIAAMHPKKIQQEIKIKVRPSLESKILSTLSEEEEILFFTDSNVYCLGNLGKKGKTVNYKGISFELKECEYFWKIERITFENNQKKIEEYRSNALSELSKDYESSKQEIARGISALAQDRFSVARYIVENIFAHHHGKKINPRKIIKQEKEDPELILNINFSIEDFNIFPKVSEKIKKDRNREFLGYLILFGEVYGANESLDLDKISLMTHLGRVENLDRLYGKGIEDIIENKTKESFNELIARINTNRIKIDSINTNVENYNENNAEEGDIGFFRKEEDRYIVYRKFDDFIMKKNGNYFRFPGAKLAATICHSNKGLKLEIPGFILSNGRYHHPFTTVSSGGESILCRGNLKWDNFGEYNISENWQPINFLEANHFAGQVLTVLNAVENGLRYGIAGEGAFPHTGLNETNFSNNFISKEEATRLTNSGMRLCDNDNYSSRRIG